MKRPRFTVRRLMVAVAVVAGVLAFISVDCGPEGSGFASIPLQFTVLDAVTGKPVPGATIRLLRVIEPEYQANPTELDGRTALVIRARCGISGGIINRRWRGVNYLFWTLEVEAEGYLKFRSSLEKYTTDRRFHESYGVQPPILIRLRKSPGPPELERIP
jgi:hypothetical protein